MQPMLVPTSEERPLSPSGTEDNRWVWPLMPKSEYRSLLASGADSEYRSLLASGADSEYRSSDDPAAEPYSGGGAVLEKLIELWAVAAVSHAKVRDINDPDGLVATVVGIDGAWGFGSSSEEALADLRSVLVDWATLKLEDGDDDIPSMEGLHLVVAR